MKERITISINKEILKKIDERKEDISRSLYINRVLKEYIERRLKKR